LILIFGSWGGMTADVREGLLTVGLNDGWEWKDSQKIVRLWNSDHVVGTMDRQDSRRYCMAGKEAEVKVRTELRKHRLCKWLSSSTLEPFYIWSSLGGLLLILF
jgi:hypothetical protein